MNRHIKHKTAMSLVRDISSHPEKYVSIHYSCESFLATSGGCHSPRITSIAIYDLSSKQTHAFSLHLVAEELDIDLSAIDLDTYNILEGAMLSKYMKFLSENKNKFFIHWNMRDTTYGFLALEHRYTILSKTLFSPSELIEIPDTNKINLPDLLLDIYGPSYIGHPQMVNLIEMNNLRPKCFLSGKEEGEAFKNHEFVPLHASTCSKVRVFSYIIERIANNSLKTQAKWKDIHGVSPQSIWEFINTKWYTSLGMSFITLILGALMGKYL